MPKFARFLLTVLLVWHGAAFAQTSTAAKPTPSITTSTSTTATRKPANTGEIFRWVDKNGKVQYGADVPEDRRATAKKVDTRSNIVSSRVPASISPAAPPAASGDGAAPIARQPITEREKCEAAWQRYNESVACFSQNRQGINAGRTGTGISVEAQTKCQNITEPAPCR
ncbi:DUF4124 domain-containing protein [Variovorax sp. PCZ-1]|uniref:DUF4124 domain-containing protein n=1 Tax=Variovorax sp. PCZ-1 TaxID=2835533 RepID=UPI001BCAC4E5|nr:DUF4124 domain-containing protein [Variovorax sp. PCZ-1]MBS7807299.1 DUF4124 domain-containing protein [Variovorax sp. PCZ-1]